MSSTSPLPAGPTRCAAADKTTSWVFGEGLTDGQPREGKPDGGHSGAKSLGGRAVNWSCPTVGRRGLIGWPDRGVMDSCGFSGDGGGDDSAPAVGGDDRGFLPPLRRGMLSLCRAEKDCSESPTSLTDAEIRRPKLK